MSITTWLLEEDEEKDRNRWVSSAYSAGLFLWWVCVCGRGTKWARVTAEPSDLVYSEHRNGSNTEPWGTPISREQGLDKEPFHVTWKVRFVRYDVNQVRAESAVFSQSQEEDLVVDCVKRRG